MQRQIYIDKIKRLFNTHNVVALLGPRQCGKTTLARMYSSQIIDSLPINIFDLEDPLDIAKLQNPKLALENLEGLIIIDEIQRRPELFPVLRVLVDSQKKQNYLILGSASRDLISQSSETLAGRIAYIEVKPFSYQEVGEIKDLWLKGGFPRSYLTSSQEESLDWRKHYVNSFLERDIPALGIKIPTQNMRRFWMMISHYNANIVNLSELGKSLSLSDSTVKRYIDILSGTFMIRQLQPWFENISKRQVKMSKIYFRDSGIFHYIAGIKSYEDLMNHPKLGASFESFALEEVIRKHDADPEDCYFWGTHNNAELDLLILHKGQKIGFEFKYTDSPKLTKSMHIALEDLSLDQIFVIFPGKGQFPLHKKIKAISLEEYISSSI